MLVAMPTAMPEEPFTSRFGARVGNTAGSHGNQGRFASLFDDNSTDNDDDDFDSDDVDAGDFDSDTSDA